MKHNRIFIPLILILIVCGCKKTDKVQPIRKDIVDVVFASGTIIMENQYFVISQSEGYIKNIFAKEGDTVKQNQLLFEIVDNSQQAQLATATASYEYALNNAGPNSAILRQLESQRRQIVNKLTTDSVNYFRYKKLVSTNAVSQADFEKMKLAYENSQADLDVINNSIINTSKNLELEKIRAKSNLISQQENTSYFTIKSDLSGFFLQKTKNRGEYVRRGETLAEIGSGEFIVKLEIAEEDINKIKIGQIAYIELNTEKNKSYKAKISRIYPSFNKNEQSFIVEARFSEPVHFLKSGTQLQANIEIQFKKQALVIPSYYLLPNDYVIVKGKTEKIQIETGIKTFEWVEVLNGLDENSILLMPK